MQKELLTNAKNLNCLLRYSHFSYIGLNLAKTTAFYLTEQFLDRLLRVRLVHWKRLENNWGSVSFKILIKNSFYYLAWSSARVELLTFPTFLPKGKGAPASLIQENIDANSECRLCLCKIFLLSLIQYLFFSAMFSCLF